MSIILSRKDLRGTSWALSCKGTALTTVTLIFFQLEFSFTDIDD